ncbi:hypothetical protein [Pseudomonas tohonis]|uniref:hypothetical protein n=1 Tax=Pseudomonas tohonis TaxID=2725477 RepID=UPI0022EFDA7C|nr:hypothetical protein [Pseudomonas tohonis]
MKPKRLKLWNLTAHISFQELFHRFQQLPFAEEKRVGFEPIEVLEGRATIRYHEQRTITQFFVNPLGETIESNYSIYINFDMFIEELEQNLFSICMSAPPKDLKPFVELMQTAIGTTFALEIVKPDISVFYEQLKRDKRLTRVMAKRIISGSVNVDIESSYRIDIVSTANAMTKLLEITGGRTTPIDKIKITYQYDHKPVLVDLSRSGSIQVSVDDDDHLRYLTSLMRR